ncbi:hypothetical protein FQN57_000703 [Myotisia sp. PD_48]|nr:hypothetical protein FQN57_000703 [Myotisia sp. PD_48]
MRSVSHPTTRSQDFVVKPYPYYAEQKLVVQSHIPPALISQKELDRAHSHRGRLVDHPLKECVRHPPLPGKDGSQTIELDIIREIRTGEKHSAQLVLLRYMILSMGTLKSMAPFMLQIVTIFECPAYSALKDLQGKTIPKFFGSFTLKLQAQFKEGIYPERFVRMILIESVQGRQMDNLDRSNLSQSQRQSIMKQIIDFETTICSRNMQHRDLYPRNVMVNWKNMHVTFIDFAHVEVVNPDDHPSQSEEPFFAGSYVSPLLRWRSVTMREEPFVDWIDWDWDPWIEAVYTDTRNTITKAPKEYFERVLSSLEKLQMPKYVRRETTPEAPDL